MTRALLIGKEPAAELGYDYVMETPYDAVVIGSLTLSQLLRFREERVLSALAEGKPVYLYTPGLPEAPKNRALSGSLTAAQRDAVGKPCLCPAGTEKLGRPVYGRRAEEAHHGGGSPRASGGGETAKSRRGADAAGEGNYGGEEMKVGKVVGAIWATRKAACLQGQTFLVVESNGEKIVAADQVGAGTGDKVLLATGTVASKYCMDAPVDAAVVAIVDEKQ